MDSFWNPDSFKALQTILNPEGDSSDDEVVGFVFPFTYWLMKGPKGCQMTPGDVGPKKKRKGEFSWNLSFLCVAPKAPPKPVDPNAIWDAEEIPESGDFNDLHDPRPQPE